MLMFKEIIVPFASKQQISTFRHQNAEPDFKSLGTYSNHCALKAYTIVTSQWIQEMTNNRRWLSLYH